MAGNEVSTVKELKGILAAEKVKSRFNEVLGKKAPQFMSSIINVVTQNNQLKQCSANSIMSSAMVAASYDLPIDSNLGFSALVPYKLKDVGYQAQFQIMYKGFIQLAIRSGYYKRMNYAVVYADELESYNPIYGDIEFAKDFTKCVDRKSGDRSKIIGYFAWFELNTGYRQELFMTVDDVENHASKYSQAYRYDKNNNKKNSKWTTDFDAMALKTVIKMLLSKWGILSVEMQRALEDDQKVFDDNGNGKYSDNEHAETEVVEEVVDVFDQTESQEQEQGKMEESTVQDIPDNPELPFK